MQRWEDLVTTDFARLLTHYAGRLAALIEDLRRFPALPPS